MKKSIYLIGLFFLAGSMVITSCKKDEDEPTPVDLTPILTFIGNAGYTSGDAQMAPQETFKVGINAFENTTSKTNLASFKVVRTFNNIPTTVFEKINIRKKNSF